MTLLYLIWGSAAFFIGFAIGGYCNIVPHWMALNYYDIDYDIQLGLGVIDISFTRSDLRPRPVKIIVLAPLPILIVGLLLLFYFTFLSYAWLFAAGFTTAAGFGILALREYLFVLFHLSDYRAAWFGAHEKHRQFEGIYE